MLQILLRITEAVMQKPKENQTKDTFAQSMAGLLFRVSESGAGWFALSQLPTVLVEYYNPTCITVKEGFLVFC